MAERKEARRTSTFNQPPTVDEVLNELTYLQSIGLGDAKVRATTTLAFDADGGYLRKLTIEGEPGPRVIESERTDRS